MNHVLTFTVAALIAVASAYFSWALCDWSWFQRSGNLVAVSGILLEYWQVLTTPKADSMPFWRTQEGHSAARVAIVIVCFGSVIQGYGDLLSRVAQCK